MLGHSIPGRMIRARRSGVISASVALAMLALAGPVAAATPTIEFFHHPASFEVADCGSFQIVGSWIFDVRIATYFDTSGSPVRQELNIRRAGTIENSVTGKSLNDSGTFMFEVDLATGTITSPGVAAHNTAPHVGIVWLGAGLVRVDADGNVTFSTPSNTDSAAACAYFAS